MQHDEWGAKARARAQARDFLNSYSGCAVTQPIYSIMLDGLAAVILKADTAAERRGIERAAKVAGEHRNDDGMVSPQGQQIVVRILKLRALATARTNEQRKRVGT